MKTWKYRTPKQFLASCVWNLSEWSHIGLGRFAPKVFGAMIGSKPKKKQIKKMKNQLEYPQQCQDKAKELLSANGYDKALSIISAEISKLRKAHAKLDIRIHTQLKIDLACDVDFWSQTKQSIEINK